METYCILLLYITLSTTYGRCKRLYTALLYLKTLKLTWAK